MLHQVIVYTIIAIFIGISQSAGIGGGPILNISLMVGFGLSAKVSMSITYIFLMGGALASMLVNVKKKNPKTGTPLMDYSLIMVTLPMAATGSICGALFNHFISQLIITLLFTFLLTFLSINSYKKYKQISQQKVDESIKTLLLNMSPNGKVIIEHQINPRLQQILDEQKEVYPIDKLKVIVQVFVYTVIILLLKGGRHYDSYVGFQSCGIFSYLCVILHVVVSVLYSKSLAMKQYEIDMEKQKLGYVFESEAEKMTSSKMRSSMFFGYFAGFIGSTLGLGGAIILVPAWINNGIDRNVAAGSSGPLIFFSAMVAYILSMLSGQYDSYLIQIFYFILAFVGAYVVKQIVNHLTIKYNLKAMIFLLLLVTMLSSLIVLLPYQFIKYLDDPVTFNSFHTFC